MAVDLDRIAKMQEHGTDPFWALVETIREKEREAASVRDKRDEMVGNPEFKDHFKVLNKEHITIVEDLVILDGMLNDYCENYIEEESNNG